MKNAFLGNIKMKVPSCDFNKLPNKQLTFPKYRWDWYHHAYCIKYTWGSWAFSYGTSGLIEHSVLYKNDRMNRWSDIMPYLFDVDYRYGNFLIMDRFLYLFENKFSVRLTPQQRQKVKKSLSFSLLDVCKKLSFEDVLYNIGTYRSKGIGDEQLEKLLPKTYRLRS
mgnify:CR=1 FL=1